MNILDEIVANKRKEVEERKSLYPTKLLEKSVYFNAPVVSLKKYLLRPDKEGIIAEIKRKSPSKGVINQHISIEKVSIGYMQAGASALSVLTDTKYFGGTNDDLMQARKFNYCPILRKDFTVDEYQIIEARSIGADAILLLANVLSKEEIQKLTEVAHNLGLEVLLELRDKEEIKSLNDKIDIVGINNRNLKDFKTDIQQSFDMVKLLPKDMVKVSESGISNAETILKLREAGFNGFLIGETFMSAGQPHLACAAFINEIRKQKPVTA